MREITNNQIIEKYFLFLFHNFLQFHKQRAYYLAVNCATSEAVIQNILTSIADHQKET